MKLRPLHLASRAAFTLLEIMLVVMIIALLAGAAIYMMGGNVEVARDVRLKTDIQGISTQIKVYSIATGSYPTTEQGLKALVTRPEGVKQWRQTLQQMPLDPWQREYVYLSPGKHNPENFDLYSKGPDGKADTADDVGNW
jgi:general secretion pathway protein G